MVLFDGTGDRLWTISEVATALDYSEAYIRERAEAGILPSFKVDGELMFSKAELEGWLLKLKVVFASSDDVRS
ncbi:MAG TPA: helix-turn-helix domain-containing protein [Gaiellaceae bacterium]